MQFIQVALGRSTPSGCIVLGAMRKAKGIQRRCDDYKTMPLVQLLLRLSCLFTCMRPPVWTWNTEHWVVYGSKNQMKREIASSSVVASCAKLVFIRFYSSVRVWSCAIRMRLPSLRTRVHGGVNVNSFRIVVNARTQINKFYNFIS